MQFRSLTISTLTILLFLGIAITAVSSHNVSLKSNVHLDKNILVYDLRPYRLHAERRDHLEVSDFPLVLAAQVCAGLMNMNETVAGQAYSVWDQEDLDWLLEIENISEPIFNPLEDILSKCLSTVAKGRYIHYSYEKQKEIFPNIVTLPGILNAVPLIDSNETRPLLQNATMVFDAEKEFEGFSAYNATLYMFEHFASQTTTMSKLSPGYKFWKKHSNRKPKLTGQMDLRSVDYITKARLFNFYLLNGCIPCTKDHSLMETMTQHNHPNTSQWPQPIVVMGFCRE